MRSRIGVILAVLLGVAVVALVNVHRARHAPRVLAAPPPTTGFPVPVALCPPVAGAHPVEDFRITMAARSSPPVGRPVLVVATRCADPAGNRYPSRVVIAGSSDSRAIATLIDPARRVHVSDVSVSKTTITVTYTDWAVGLTRGDLGAMYRQRFLSTDGTAYVAATPQRLYSSCLPDGLRLSGLPGPTRDAELLKVVNTGKQPCVLEGYPTVSSAPVLTASSSTPVGLPVARQEFRGHTGGVTSASAPPIVLLKPGQVASAAVDSASQSPDGGATLCTSLTRLQVGVASGLVWGPVPVAIRVCDFQVHPWVAGPSGSG